MYYFFVKITGLRNFLMFVSKKYSVLFSRENCQSKPNKAIVIKSSWQFIRLVIDSYQRGKTSTI